jgi:DNA invertase Pin-like site-specific DNA recombinase
MLQINVRAAVAQLEREIITERVKAGIAPPGRAG